MADRTVITVHSTNPKKISELFSSIADDFEMIHRVASHGAVIPIRNKYGRMLGTYEIKKRIHQ